MNLCQLEVNLSEAEATALRELSKRFPASDLARKAAISAVKSRCARLAFVTGKDEVAVLCKGSNRIDVLNNEEYFRVTILTAGDLSSCSSVAEVGTTVA